MSEVLRDFPEVRLFTHYYHKLAIICSIVNSMTQNQALVQKPGESGLARQLFYLIIRESVDSLCRNGADAQYMQYLLISKSHITGPH